MVKFWFYYSVSRIVHKTLMIPCFKMYLKTHEKFWYNSYWKIEQKVWRKVFNKCADEVNTALKYHADN